MTRETRNHPAPPNGIEQEDFPMTGLKATRTGFRLQPLSRGGHIDQRTMISYPKPRVDMYGNEFKGGKGKF